MCEKTDYIPEAPEGMCLTDIYFESAQFPGIVIDEETIRVHYQSFIDRHDRLKVGIIGNKGLENVEVISGRGEVLYPVGISHKEKTWYAWSETKDGGWAIYARYLQNKSWSEIFLIEQDHAVFYPQFFTFKEQLYLAWTRQRKKSSKAMIGKLGESGISEVESVSIAEEAYRMNACEGGDGNLYVTYDAYTKEGYHAYSRVKTNLGWSEEIRLDCEDAWVCNPRVIRSEKGATVCWYTFEYGAEYSICYIDLSTKEGTISRTEPVEVLKNVGWYMDFYAAADCHGLQVLAYTWGKDTVHVRYRKGSDVWSEPAQVSFEDEHCAVHPSFVIDNETIYMVWQFAHRNGHYVRNASVILNKFDVDTVMKKSNIQMEQIEKTFCLPIEGEKSLDTHSKEEMEKWLLKNGYKEKLLFGDIHGQSGISDGMGFIDQYYRRSLDKANLQFSCLTDHDCYPDWISQSEWELMRTTADLMNEDEELTCLLSYEWTPNEYQYDFGHKNIYYRDNDGDIFRSGEPSGITPTDLYRSIKKYNAICIPHHPAADWGMVSASTDWSFHDEEVERLVEIFSRHASYEDYESQSIYTKNIKKKERHSVQDALAKGYRMGFTAGSDSHQMDHGIEGGIVAVYSSSHNREGIWDAMYNRMTYGTTGARILLSFKANGKPMGSEIEILSGEKLLLNISVLGTKDLKVELIKNNEVIQKWEAESREYNVSFSVSEVSNGDFYYIRVTQVDKHMAWSSPIWINLISV